MTPRPNTGDGADGAPVDAIFHGGEILALDAEGTRVEALCVRDGRVAELGPRERIDRRRGDRTRLVDLGGGFLIPALVDHHVHLLNVGVSVVNRERDRALLLDLGSATSEEEIALRVARRAAEAEPGEWILGKAWNHFPWSSRELPDRRSITSAAPDHPVYLARIDGHCGWINAEAMRRAGIGRATPDPPGGALVRDGAGAPTGILLERACEAVLRHLPRLSDEEVVACFRSATRALAARGVTRVQDAGFLEFPSTVDLDADMERYLELLLEADHREPLPVDVHLMVIGPGPLAEELLRHPDRFRRLSPRIRTTHLKLYADGAFGSRGADLSHPYADDLSTSGVVRMSREEIATLARRALDADLDLAVHAIGDAAITRVLDVYEEILEERPDLLPRRLRVEHFSCPRRDDLERAARLGVLLVVQPLFVEPDDSGRIMEEDRIGPERARRAYAFGELTERGAILAGSTDLFGDPPPPLASLHAACTRTNAAGRPRGGWQPGQRLDRLAALRLHTRWFPGGGREPTGGLSPGADADLALFSLDPLAARGSRLREAEVLAAWRRGVPIHDPDGLDPISDRQASS